jgi:hypothetical protein
MPATLLLALLSAATPALGQSGGDYVLRLGSFDSGGAGSSSGGDYSAYATIAQPLAGAMQGGGYEVRGGFWSGPIQVTDAPPPPAARPDRFAVFAPSPNPSRDRVVVAFDLPRETRARVAVFSVTGQRIRSLLDGVSAAGRHQVWWDGRDEAGRRVHQGVYFVRVEAGADAAVKKLARVE